MEVTTVTQIFYNTFISRSGASVSLVHGCSGVTVSVVFECVSALFGDDLGRFFNTKQFIKLICYT